MTTQAQIDALKATVVTLTAQVNALTPDVTTPPIVNPTIINFKATPSTITVGQSTVLDAIVTNAVALTLDGAPVTLPVTVTPTADHTYTLQAMGVPGSTIAAALAGVVVNAVVPPPADGLLVPLLGGALKSSQFAWLPNYAKPSSLLPRAVPNRIYADKAMEVAAFPMNGVKAARIRCVPALGNTQGLYSMHPRLNAKKISEPYEPNFGSDISSIAIRLRADPPPVGPRGIGYLSPYCTLLGHPTFKPDGSTIPHAPKWMALRHDGYWQNWMRDDSIQGNGYVPGVQHCVDFDVDPTNRKRIAICNFGDPVEPVGGIGPKNWRNGGIIGYDRGPGAGANGVPEDATKWVPDAAMLIPMPNGIPVGVKYADDGTLFAADNISGEIYRCTPAGDISVIARLPWIVAMDYFNGRLYCLDNRTQFFVVDALTGAISPNLSPPALIEPGSKYGEKFWTLRVDKFGTAGIKGTVAITRDISHNGGNLDKYDFVPDAAAPNGFRFDAWKGGQGWERTGDSLTVQEMFSHYPWGYFNHPDQGIVAACGVSSTFQELRFYKTITEGGAPEIPFKNYNFELGNRGVKVACTGASKGAPFNKPSPTTMVTKEGWSEFPGCRYDDIADMPSFDVIEEWVMSGMIGIYRYDTPDLKLPDRYAWLHHILRNSMRFHEEGQAFLDRFDAWWVAKYGPVPTVWLPQDHPTTPLLPEDRYCVPKPDGSGVEMWNIDGRRSDWPVPAGVTILYDKGLPSESAVKPNRPAAAIVTNLPPGYLTRAVIVS